MTNDDHLGSGRYNDDPTPSLGSGVVAFEVPGHTNLLVERDEPTRQPHASERTQISVGGRELLVDRARVGLEAALEGVRPAAKALLEQFKSLSDEVTEVELEFGLKLSGEAGAIIARTSAEGHCTVKIKFVRKP